MATRGVAFTATFMALDSATGRPKTGDSANITAQICKDGTAAAPTTTTVTEVESTKLKGLYKISVSATEADCDELVAGGNSATSGIDIVPTTYQMERLPNAAPGASGGVLLVGTGTGGLNVSGGRGDADVKYLLGTPWLTPGTAGTPDVNTKTITNGAIAAATFAANALDAVWSTAARTLTSFGTLVADAAAAVWAVATSTLTGVGSIGKRIVDYLTGDAFARIGAAGAGLTALGDTRIANLDAAVSSRGTGTALDAAGVQSAVGLATANLDTQLAAIQADSPNRVTKNVALAGFTFFMRDSTNHAAATGLTITAQRSLDGAAFGACANSATEVSNGLYTIDLAAADLNGNVVSLRFTAAGADDLVISFPTQPT